MAPNPTSVQYPAQEENDVHSVLLEDILLREDIEAAGIESSKSSLKGSSQRPSRAKSRRFGNYQSFIQLSVFALAELIGGFTFSLLSPFYTKEATAKGLSVSETGLVYGSVFVTTIIFSPIFGKYINSIGSRNLFLYGTFLAGSTNVLFGFLEYVNGRKTFFILSLAIRIVSAIGESAFFCAIYPLATQAAPSNYRSTVLSVMETMFGLGLMIGPFLGGLLYELGGFYLPFVVCGSILTVCPIFAMFFIGGSAGYEPIDDEESTPFKKLLKMPCVSLSCLILCIAQASVSWYLPSLQPFLETKHHLSTFATGAMFTVEGATYAAFSPLWGWLLDKWISPWFAMTTGTLCVIIGYLLLGPSPLLPFLPTDIYLVGFALSLMGFGVAATFITTLTFMLSESVNHGAADNEQTRGMITSLWFISENMGGYIGASLGGLAFDKIGFEHGTSVIVGLQLIALLAIPLMWKLNKWSITSQKDNQGLTTSHKSSLTSVTLHKPNLASVITSQKSKSRKSSDERTKLFNSKSQIKSSYEAI